MMNKRLKQNKKFKLWASIMSILSFVLIDALTIKAEVANLTSTPGYIGTFEGSTTFITSSSNGINPGLFIEVMNRYGELIQYESRDGVISIPNSKEGAYVTQAKLLGKTKYRDIKTGEILDEWEDGRNLELISVENPELKIVGKNLYDASDPSMKTSWWIGDEDGNGIRVQKDELSTKYSILVPIDVGEIYHISGTNFTRHLYAFLDENYETLYLNQSSKTTAPAPNKAKYLLYYLNHMDIEESSNIQVEVGDVATPYSVYQSSSLTLDKEVILRGVEKATDSIDLMTGQVVRLFAKRIVKGDHGWVTVNTSDMNVRSYFKDDESKPMGSLISPTMKHLTVNEWNALSATGVYKGLEGFGVVLPKAVLESNTLGSFTKYMSQNPIEVWYEQANPVTEPVGINKDYHFRPVNTRDIYIDGSVAPLICSVSMPTESLRFVLNPNQEKGQQFIAPEFSVTNETPASIKLILKSFEQESDVFNDVLPTAHEDWGLLDQEQSKDIALALVPKLSDGWIELNEGPYYVADHQSLPLGRIKGYSTVEFAFEAFHGRAFLEELNPRYKLVFIFDF